MEHESSEKVTKLNREKKILQLKPPLSSKELKSFLGPIQDFAKFLPRQLEKTDRMKQLLKNKTEWKRTENDRRIILNLENGNRRTMTSTLR